MVYIDIVEKIYSSAKDMKLLKRRLLCFYSSLLSEKRFLKKIVKSVDTY